MKLYGLIGKPLSHSFSQSYFTKKYKEMGITDCRYQNFELQSVEEVHQLIEDHANLKGFNITIPYKESILPLLHYQNNIVKSIGACNCVKIVDAQLHGYNTDVIGFKLSLTPHLKPHHKKALVLGTGGAAKAVYYVLQELGISYKMVSRNKSSETITYYEIEKSTIEEYSILINTSPIGMYPKVEEAPALPYQYITQQHLLFDLIYNPEQTLFLKKGLEKGAAICNGYEMLVIQAEESWKIWNSVIK